MQELNIRDGATLVISLDGFNWISGRRCNDKGIKKRDGELQLWISSGQMIQADEELPAISCIFDQRGSAAPHLWRNSVCRSSLVTCPPPSCLLEQPTLYSTPTSLTPFASVRPQDVLWTRLVLNMRDIFNGIKKDSNTVTQQDTMDQQKRFIVFCGEDSPLQSFSDVCYTDDATGEDTRWHISANRVLSDLSTAHSANSNRNQHELVIRDDCDNRRNSSVKKRKSVSFDDDVMVYLFDQESPTLELHSEADTSLPDVTLQDSGLEWEDDFSALEKNCHFQSTGQRRNLTRPTQRSADPSQRFFLSQTYLFLTHVSQSDLEL